MFYVEKGNGVTNVLLLNEFVIEHKLQQTLELQIEQLQMRLQQEKSVRMLLERALGRTSSTLSPGHRHSANQVTDWCTSSNV